MKKCVAKGVYPVMITPYTADNRIDDQAVDRMVDFYVNNGCQGIFAVCQSSEMFFLSEEERVTLAARVVKAAAGRVSVVASGHISDDPADQLREIKRVAATGVDAVVLISNRFAKADESDEVFIRNMNELIAQLPEDIALGMYECPYPYTRLLTPTILDAMKATGRFVFIKDTCCAAPLIAQRIAQLDGEIQLFNANAATVLETMKAGADGFSGIMANFHPDLYDWLLKNYKKQPEKAKELSAILSILSGSERCLHPIGAKYHMNLIGIPMTLHSRAVDCEQFGYLQRHEIDDMLTMEGTVRKWLKM